MKKFALLSSFIIVLSLTLSILSSAADLNISIDFSIMAPEETPSAEELKAYKIENVKIVEFNAEGNILAAKSNGSPSYLIYKLSAGEGMTLNSLRLKSYASVNDYSVEGAPLAGNKFGIYVSETENFDFETDKPVDGASGMVGKKNHT